MISFVIAYYFFTYQNATGTPLSLNAAMISSVFLHKISNKISNFILFDSIWQSYLHTQTETLPLTRASSSKNETIL